MPQLLRYVQIMRHANSMNSCAASVGVQQGMIATACAAALRIRPMPFSSFPTHTRGMAGRRAEDKNGESRDINLAKGVQPRVTVVQLRSMLRAMGLPTTGTKTELVERAFEGELESSLKRAKESLVVKASDAAAADPVVAAVEGVPAKKALSRRAAAAETGDIETESRGKGAGLSRAQRLSAIADAAKGTGMMKDLLTGEDLRERDRLVSSANDAFYNAYEAGDFDAMAKVWGRASHVKCSHPGRPIMLGYRQVMDSWRQVFSTAAVRFRFHIETDHVEQTKRSASISVTDIRIVSLPSVAWVTCLETHDQGHDEEALQVMAINIFRLQRLPPSPRAKRKTEKWLLDCRFANRLATNA